jgi:hypothetical protein
MPCLGVLIALMAPRFLMIVLWLFTSWFKGVFASAIWPILGFFLLPVTTLWYSAVHHWWGGQWGLFQILGMALALWTDIGPSRRAKKARRRAQREAEHDPSRDDLGRPIN